MAIKSINPYINIQNGAARRAIEHYEHALGAKAAPIMRFGDVPGMEAPAGMEDSVMHSELKIGKNTLMVCDAPPGIHAKPGETVHIVLHFDGPEELAEAFDALAVGGTVTMAPHDAFWGDKFGLLTDQFGVPWMFVSPQK